MTVETYVTHNDERAKGNLTLTEGKYILKVNEAAGNSEFASIGNRTNYK